MKTKYFFLAIGWLLFCNSCINYSAGNRVTLDYPVDTKLNYNIVRMYLDTLAKTKYRVPEKWIQYDKLVDIDSENSKRIYFESSPEEMYLIQFNGVLLLADVFNPRIVKDDYIGSETRMPVGEKERVLNRFKNEILDSIEQMAKQDGCPDSILYFKPVFVNNKWSKGPVWKE